MRPGEELVVEPFQRLIDAGELVAYRHRGFWASMDTLRDKQMLEDMLEKGRTPWLPWTKEQRRGMKALALASRQAPAHCCASARIADDIEIGCGATILDLLARGVRLEVALVRAVGDAGARH